MPKEKKPYHMKRDDDYYSDTLPLIVERRVIKPENSENANQLHWHEFFEIEFICQGTCKHILNNKTLNLKRGSAYIIRPIDFHHIYSDSTPFTLYHIAFDIPLLSKEVADLLTSMQSVVSAEFDPEETAFIESNLKFLVKQFNSNDPNAKYILRAGVEQLIIIILQKSNISLNPQKATDYPPVMQQIIAYLGLHFRNTIHLYDIAEMFHLSTNYLGELFYNTIGRGFNDYINDIRLEYAKRLLLTTNLTVSQICLESGFHTNSHFIMLFKNKYGVTPNRLRSENKTPH